MSKIKSKPKTNFSNLTFKRFIALVLAILLIFSGLNVPIKASDVHAEEIWYKLTFISNEGYIYDDPDKTMYESSVLAGQSIGGVPYVSDRSHYIFAGWMNQETNEIVDDLWSLKPDHDMTFIATWKEVYDITINPNYVGEYVKPFVLKLEPGSYLNYNSYSLYRDGYILDGFKIDNTGELITLDELTMYQFNSDAELFAQWSETYTITFYSAEGYIYADSNTHEGYTTVKKGEPINTFITVRGFNGHYLAGWKEDTNGDKVGDGELMTDSDLACYTPEHDVFLVAQWVAYESTVNIKLLSDDGYINGDENLKEYSFLIPYNSNFAGYMPELSRSGYAAALIDTNDPNNTEILVGSNEYYDISLKEDTTYRVKWIQKTTYNINYYSEEGYFFGDKTIKNYSVILDEGKSLGYNSPSIYGYDHHVISGWKIKNTNTVIDINELYNYYPEGDMDLIAVWADACLVTLYSEEGYFSGNRFNKTKTFNIIKNKNFMYNYDIPYGREGYSLEGWKIDTNNDYIGEGDLITNEDLYYYQITEDTTFIAQWTTTYTVTLISEAGYISGTRMKTQETINVPEGKKTNDYTTCYGRPGYVFIGWRIKDTNTIIDELDDFIPDSDITLIAEWEEAYKITLHSESGFFDGTPNRKDIIYYLKKGDSVNSSQYYQTPYGRNNYVFDYYKTEDNTEINPDTFIPTGDITLNAVWIESITVTFDANEGVFDNYYHNTSITQQVKKGKKITVESYSTPIREGYIFKGWKQDGFSAEPWYYNTTGTFNSNVTFKAQWAKSYTLTFESAEGYIEGNKNQKSTSKKVAQGEIISYAPSCYDRSGYILTGWKIKNTSTIIDVDDINNYKPTSDMTFVAVWENAIKVSFDANGGVFNDDDHSTVITYEYRNGKDVYVYPTEPTREGYTIVGWKIDGDDTQYSSFSIHKTFTNDVTFKAIWGKSVKVTYKLNGGYMNYGPGGIRTDDYVVNKLTGNYLSDYVSVYHNDDSLIFVGWKNLDTNTVYTNSELANLQAGTSDMTFEAQFGEAVNVTFDLNGGYYKSGPGHIHVTENPKFKTGKGGNLSNSFVNISVQSDTPRTACDGWTKGDDTSKIYTIEEIKALKIEENMTFKAHWNTNAYIVKFVSDDGYLSSDDPTDKSREYYYNYNDQITSVPVSTGYFYYRNNYYIDYFIDDENTHYSSNDFYNYKVTKDVTFKAVWKVGNTIVFDSNGGYLSLGPGGSGEKITKYYATGQSAYLYTPEYLGYTFQGWFITDNTELNGKTLQASSEYIVKGNATFKAIWKNNATGEIIGGNGSNNQNNNQNKNQNNNQNNNSGAKNSSNSGNSSGSSNNTDNTKKTPKYSSEWINGKWYDVNGNQTYEGTLSWKSNSTGWWVEDSAGWYPVSQWQRIDGVWYYFNSSGYMASGEYYNGYWFNSDGSWDDQYYLTWKSNSTGWWVEDKSGWWPSSSWLKVDGSWYYFNSSGYMVTSQYVDGYWIGSDGVCN